jgi:hypothetical protein
MKDRSERNFISCPFPCALGKDTTTQKPEKKGSPPPATRDQHFDLFWATVAGRTTKKWLVTFRRDGIAKERPIR